MKKDLFIFSDSRETYRIPCQDIVRFEANGRYTVIHRINNQKQTICKNIGDVLKMLADKSYFAMPHKSHIINLNHMLHYKKEDGGTVIMNHDCILPVARDRKALFNRIVKQQ